MALERVRAQIGCTVNPLSSHFSEFVNTIAIVLLLFQVMFPSTNSKNSFVTIGLRNEIAVVVVYKI